MNDESRQYMLRSQGYFHERGIRSVLSPRRSGPNPERNVRSFPVAGPSAAHNSPVFPFPMTECWMHLSRRMLIAGRPTPPRRQGEAECVQRPHRAGTRGYPLQRQRVPGGNEGPVPVEGRHNHPVGKREVGQPPPDGRRTGSEVHVENCTPRRGRPNQFDAQRRRGRFRFCQAQHAPEGRNGRALQGRART